MLLFFVAVVPDPPRHERRLIKRARAGDVAAFEELLEVNGEAMRRLAYSMLGSEALMDEVLQIAYVKAFRALPRFDGRSSFGTWLHRIVANAAVDELRRIARRGEVDLDALEGRAAAAVASDGADVASDTARRLDLADALAALPADLRIVVLMVDAEGYSYDEVAEVVGIPPGTVASRLHRARAALRPALGAGEVAA
jgi:RNA polymerase sigma-70 factor, ECF subfamily